MKALSGIFIFFTIVGWKTNGTSAFLRIDDVAFDLNGEEARSEELFARQYGHEALAVASLGSNRVEKAKAHLAAVSQILAGNPLGARFEYLLALCDDYPKLRKLEAITKNIYDFVVESGRDVRANSFVSFGGGNSALSAAADANFFFATRIRTDNEDELKSYLDGHEAAMKKAAEERERMLAAAAKMREEMWKTAQRHRRAAFEWAEELRRRMAIAAGTYSYVGGGETRRMQPGMAGADGTGGGKRATTEAAKKAKGRPKKVERDRRDDATRDTKRRSVSPKPPFAPTRN